MKSGTGHGRRGAHAGRLSSARLLLSLCLVAAGCSSINVFSDFDPSADFDRYKTWDWLPDPSQETPDPRPLDAVVRGRIESAVAAELLERGFRLSLDAPDFFVAYHASIDSALEMQVVNEYYNYPYEGSYGSTWGPALHGRTALPREFEQGTIMVDVLDAATRQLVWRGTAQAEVYPDLDDKQREERVRKAIHKVLGQFPPR